MCVCVCSEERGEPGWQVSQLSPESVSSANLLFFIIVEEFDWAARICWFYYVSAHLEIVIFQMFQLEVFC